MNRAKEKRRKDRSNAYLLWFWTCYVVREDHKDFSKYKIVRPSKKRKISYE